MNKAFERGAPAPGKWIVAAILIAITATHAQEKEKKFPLSIDMHLKTSSAYVWRGKVLDKDPVTQPSIIGTLDLDDYGSFSMKVWSNWDLSTKQSNSKTTKNNGGINVLEFVPSYSKDFGPVGVTIGSIWYTFYPRTVNSTRELFLTLAYKNPVVTPSITVYYDYWEVGEGFMENNPYDNIYCRAALNKTIPINDRLSLSGTALLGAAGSHYNEVRYRSSDGEGFADYEFSTCLTYAVTGNFSVAGKLAYTGLVGGGAGLDRDNISPNEIFWGGINMRLVY
ncbi:MAG: hypothetical protein PF904_05410 [Kiritimatiellae bacterium]|jgi:hypothetical protein|nr:hypothetical protein [Kiritimatiellia bacterium]